MILDKVYELEGLLKLRQDRTDLPSDFDQIIVAKARAILEAAQHLSPQSSQSPQNTPPTQSSQRNLRFPINERIRFARELFNGNQQEFDSTLRFIEPLNDWEDVEDYFYGELGWDPVKNEVGEFMSLLRHLYTRKL